MLEPRVLLDGLAMGESPRWHEGRLWFSHWGTEEIVAVDLDGNSEVVGHGPPGLGWATAWLPDGRLLLTGDKLMRQESDGSMVQHADLSAISEYIWSEIVVDGRGNIYVNSIGYDFMSAEPQDLIARGEGNVGVIALVTPDGQARKVADELAFPNGMVITPDNSTLIISESFAGRLTAYDIADNGDLSHRRVWAGGLGPDGICLDADGAIWTTMPGGETCVRVHEGGEISERVEPDRNCFATMLGGPERRTLFMLASKWGGVENLDDALAARTGQVLVADAPSPGVGWP